MPDVRFEKVYERFEAAPDRAAHLASMSTDELVMALAAASERRIPRLINVLATELLNRTRRTGAIAEHIADGVILVDDRGVISYVNRPAEHLLGRPAEALVGTRAADAVPILDVDGRPVEPDAQPSTRALDDGVTVHREFLVDREGGDRISIEAYAAPIRSEDGVIGAVLSLRDSTLKKQHEAELAFHKRLLDSVGEAVMATSPEGAILYWNKAAEALYGWPSEDVVGRNVVDVTPTETSREESLAIMRALARGEPWTGTFPVRRRDGTAFRAHVTNAPVLDRHGKLVAIIGVSRAAE